MGEPEGRRGKNIFEGGFLGLDNIGVFDRSRAAAHRRIHRAVGRHELDGDVHAQHAGHRLELATSDPAYEDVASKFFEHFVHITHAMNHMGSDGIGLWDEEDGFYYDVLHLPDGRHQPLKVRSMVGLIPLFAVGTLEPEVVDRLPGFKRRMEWFLEQPSTTSGSTSRSSVFRTGACAGCFRW